MHFKRAVLLSLVPLLVTILFSGCGQSDSTTATKSGPEKKTKTSYTIGMSQCNLGEPWRVEMNAQIKAAADQHSNLQVIYKDAQNDTLKQRSHVEEFVSRQACEVAGGRGDARRGGRGLPRAARRR